MLPIDFVWGLSPELSVCELEAEALCHFLDKSAIGEEVCSFLELGFRSALLINTPCLFMNMFAKRPSSPEPD